MRKKEFNLNEVIEGAYYPGVFIIKLKKVLHEGIQYGDFDDENWRTFVHEYVHFLQDISTSHGYLYFYFKSQLMNLAFYSIANNPSNEIELPLHTEDTGVKNAPEKEQLLDFYEGDSKLFRYHHINEIKVEYDEIITECVTGDTGLNQKLYQVNIYYDDRSDPFQFGNECIIESMAYLIEHHLFGAEQRKNEFPYNSCEAICQALYPELLDDPKRIVMLAEVVLMHEDCGLLFHGLVRLGAEMRLAELTDDDFRDFCIRNIREYTKDFDLSYKEALEGINTLFPIRFPYTSPTNEQLKVFLECGHNYRKANPLFISDAFDCADPKAYIQRLISTFDIPMLIDGNDDYYGKLGVQNIPVADAVLSILMDEKEAGCCLQTLCRKSGIACYDKNRCTDAPWENCKFDEICPVAMYFRGFGVDGKKYKWRKGILSSR